MIEGPLKGVRILDLTHVWAGPLATRVLADLGADIVKVERAYGRGPRVPGVAPIAGWVGGESGEEPWNVQATIVKLARNARSLCIDLKSSEGRNLFLKLVSHADVVIENFSARAMPAMGLDYATLRQANPSLVYVTMPGYGTYGPYRDWVAFGPTVEPMSGLTNVMGYSVDEPRNTAMALMDPICGIAATAAVVSALRRRARSGEGQYVEMSLHEAGVGFSGHWLVDHQLGLVDHQSGSQVQPIGNRHPQMAPHGVYRCVGVDCWVVIACPDDACWRALVEFLPVDCDPHWSLNDRFEHHDLIDEHLSDWCAELAGSDVAERLQGAGIPAGPVNTTPDMCADEQVVDRGFFVPLENRTPVPGNPIRMHGLSSSDWTPAAKLGADNADVLREWLDLPIAEIEALTAAGILADRPPA